MNTKRKYTYYDVLGISPRAKDDDIKRAYYTLAMRWHPDHNPGNRDAAGKALRILNQAYTSIKTKELRDSYNDFLATLRKKPPANNNVSWTRRKKTPPVFFSHLKEILWPIVPKQEAHRHG